jgi:prolyl oligopeptidase
MKAHSSQQLNAPFFNSGTTSRIHTRSGHSMPLVLEPPPFTPVEPITEVLHGVEITDPYRWLEDQNSPRTRKWIEEQTAYTRAYMDAIPGRESIRKRVEELLAVETVSELWKVRNRYFFLKRGPHHEQPAIVMREGDSGPDFILIDPAEKKSGTRVAVRIVNISHDGSLLAYSVSNSGEDAHDIEFLDVNQRLALPDRLPLGLCRGLVFASDLTGFYYVHQAVGSKEPHIAQWHAFGTDIRQDPHIFSAEPGLYLGMSGSADQSRLLYLVYRFQPSQAMDVYVQRLPIGEIPTLILKEVQGLFVPVLHHNTIVALTDWKAPNRRIVRIDLDVPEPEHWSEIVPESNSFLQDFDILDDHVVVSSVRDVASQVEIFNMRGEPQAAIPSPPLGTTEPLPAHPAGDTLFYRFTSFSQPPAIYSYVIRTNVQHLWAPGSVPLDLSSFEVEQVYFPSKDGTRVPMFLVTKKGRSPSTPLPTFLTGYGGFGASITPRFTAYATYLIERGCLFAVANIRGGAELGGGWHEAAKRHNRQCAVDDFIAAAEWLSLKGRADTGRIAIGGGSNAGLLVAAALTQRPDFFRAVLCLGPLLDMLRYHLFDCANIWAEEYGAADDVSDFPFLRDLSPYHRVRDGVSYPAVMFISGDADTRCNPLHSRKMAARLQAATTSSHPILLDYKPTWGHVPVQPLTARIEGLTDRLAFLCRELGLNNTEGSS